MKTNKKILLPLATLLGAGAIAVGSGATFTSTTANTISSVTSGTLSHTNSKDGKGILNLTNIKPGDVVNGSLTITNTGSLPADFTLTETTSANAFADGNLTLKITNTTTNAVVFNGNFGALPETTKTVLGSAAPGAANTYVFSVKLDEKADNTQQGKTASATYQWDSVQQAATVTDQ